MRGGTGAQLNDATLHAAIMASFLQDQRPPTVEGLALRLACDEKAVRQGLRSLADHHGVVLHPNSDEIWVAHPFSAAPTTFVVRTGPRSWWGNCAWCSLGVAHLAGGSATIETRLGALGAAVEVRIEDGRIVESDFVVHFPIPMRRAWDNVLFTCSVMLLFRDESDVDAWCAVRGVAKGDVRPIEQVWAFAREWYARHADVTWTKWSTREAAAMFARHGFAGPIWSLADEPSLF